MIKCPRQPCARQCREDVAGGGIARHH